MPLMRRMPKRGFNNKRFGTRYIPVNVGELNVFEDGAQVNETTLRASGLANGPGDGVKILSDGELTKKLTVSVSAFSAAAKAKIEAKGGLCEVVSRQKTPPAKV